ncbi:response regulator transcription factor [Agathobaculum sp. NSJ-28]|uniref:Stage 0 sporulation protein A homolog n=2 Tax=Agathobaculum TaxID=2048137 RepID=A0A923LSH5_9FIRM|nr:MULTISPECIES: response regulator transcription factor [Butyricicoccaceae]MBC5724481.1 response regulator transcription factor [Agathobaculum faecis]MCU6788221.1 response regulator transcription factor [Agathobaculum ammoniilyticum]WOC75170.1 response regulator transcription factor [Intestinibacillus sp. NTUH-41-i26]SCI63698.1 Sensory transduction protein regX3 [uncultured Butyricicoccus sp.]
MIYCVEDDAGIRELVVYTLQNTGLEARGFADGEALFAALREQKPDLLLLDIMLPGEDGISILRRLRAVRETAKLPVILLTAKNTEYDKVVGLDSGADDYVAKPFGMMELVARIRAVLRRTQDSPPGEGGGRPLVAGSICVDERAHSVHVGADEVQLTLKEYQLLCLLMKNQGAVLTRDVLLENIWGYGNESETRTVDVHIRTLRQKLGAGGALIETVRGVGYRMGETR